MMCHLINPSTNGITDVKSKFVFYSGTAAHHASVY